MTREEAIKILEEEAEFLYGGDEPYNKIAFDTAIEALTYQNPPKPNNTCEVDLISRAGAIEAIQNAYCKPCKERGDDHNEIRYRACAFDDAIIQIDALPSAEPTKHGEWEEECYGNGCNDYWDYTCSVCGKKYKNADDILYESNFYPNCGSKIDKGGTV